MRDPARSGLPLHTLAALRLTDALLGDPASLDRAAVLATLTPEQVVEIVFKVVFYSSNRVFVALGEDEPRDPESGVVFDYDAHGATVYRREA